MKIEGILQKNDYFCVTIKYNWLERLVGHESGLRIFRHVGQTFETTHEPIYIDKEGNKLSPQSKIGQEINKFKRKRIFHEEELHLNLN